MCEGAIFPAALGGAKIPEGVPISLGNLAWGCQILGGARFPMTPALHPGLNSTICLDHPNLEPRTPQMIALFSDCEGFVNGSSYSDGYSCRYASPSRNSNNCTRNSVIVECIDEHKTLPTGRAVLAISMMTTDIIRALNCTAFLDVSWTQTGG